MKKTVFLILALFFSFHSCAKRETKKGKTLRIAAKNHGYPTPYAHYPRGPGYTIMSLIFDSLVWKDSRGVIPWLCRDWKEEGTEWTFNLRTGVTWHDGTPMTAEDVKFTFEYMKQYPFYWSDLSIIKEVNIIEQNKIVFSLNKPSYLFLNNAAGTVPIIPKHIWKDITNPVNFTSNKAFVGSGPFVLSEYNQGKGLYIFRSNKAFFLGKPSIDNLIFIKCEKPELSLIQGEVDAALITKGKSIEIFEGNENENENEKFKYFKLPHSLVVRFLLNIAVPPLNNVKFRKALAYIVDREDMVKRVMHGYAEKGNIGQFPPDSRWYNPGVFQYPHSTEKGKKLLKELGYIDRDGDGFRENPAGETFSLEILGISRERGTTYMRVNEILARNLNNAGLKCRVKIVDIYTRDSLISQGKYQTSVSVHGGILGDPEYLKRKKSRRRISYKAGSLLGKLIDKQVVEKDERVRKKILFRIQEEFSKEVLDIPLFYPSWYCVYNSNKFKDWFLTYEGIALGIPLPWNKAVWLPSLSKTSTK